MIKFSESIFSRLISKPKPKPKTEFDFRHPTTEEYDLTRGTNADPKHLKGMTIKRDIGDGHLYYLEDKKGRVFRFDNAVDLKPIPNPDKEYLNHSNPFYIGFQKKASAKLNKLIKTL